MDEVFKQLQDLQTASATALDYAKTLVLLRALKAGTVKLDNVEMTPNGWQLTQPTKKPQATWVAPLTEDEVIAADEAQAHDAALALGDHQMGIE